MAARKSSYFAPYHLIFTNTRVIALDASSDTKDIPNPYIWVMTGALPGLPKEKMQQGLNVWGQIKTQAQGKPIVDYNQKEVTEDMMQLKNISFPYEKIKSVGVKKDFVDNNYTISFDMGLLSSETFALVNDAQSEVIALVQKTPLASRLKQS